MLFISFRQSTNAFVVEKKINIIKYFLKMASILSSYRRRNIATLLMLKRLRENKNNCNKNNNIRINRRKRYNKKQWAVKPIFQQRREQGDFFNLIVELRNDTALFKNYFRMVPEQFDMLLNLVAPLLIKNSIPRESITASQRLAVTLRYLASGDSMVSLSYAYRLGKTTVSNIIYETTDAIWTVLSGEVFEEPCMETWEQYSQDFYNLWQFPNCLGAIDGKHVVMQAPTNSGSTFYNYKGSHSLILLAVCDARYCFTLVDIGAAGRNSDGGVFASSTFNHHLMNDALNIPYPEPLPNSSTNIPVPFVFLGDEAFRLSDHVMRPYPGKFLEAPKAIYNYRLSRARRIIENSFGILVSMWRIYRRPIIARKEMVQRFIQATVCLHNWLLKQDYLSRPRIYLTPGLVDCEDNMGNIIPGTWRNDVSGNAALTNLPRIGGNAALMSVATRNELTRYFSHKGAVPWQNKILPQI